jgi:hypothetical protein
MNCLGADMNTKFTKGDWNISFVGDATYIDSDTGLTIARVFDMEDSPHDASLISAAPDMYKMLKDVADMQKQYYGYGMETHIKLAKMTKKMELILTKARGE